MTPELSSKKAQWARFESSADLQSLP